MKNRLFSRYHSKSQLADEKAIRNRNISSFAIFFILAAISVYGFIWLKNQPKNNDLASGIQQPLRKALEFNETVFGKNYSHANLVRSYPKSAAAKNVRVNGNVGMDKDFNPETWQLKVVKVNGDTLLLNIDDIRKLPKTEIIFDFKCIEGWSQVTHWGGVKFSDFVAAFNLKAEYATKYVGLSTPDEKYYVGIDMPSALHPQTLLCYEMNDKPLPMNQGYPLRMIIPVKYGIKSLKRIGSLYFSNDRPADYWYERGYDYYSGL